jgi:alpha-L-fucosidase 2
MAAGWLCQHLWRHFEFGGDREYLAGCAYPIMEDAAKFLLGFLVEDEEGYLSTAPSTSPENSFLVDKESVRQAELLKTMTPANQTATPDLTSPVAKSSTMDLTIIRELFEHCIRAAELLGVRSGFHDRLERALERLYPFKVGSYGQLQEWCFDFEENRPGMGHVSHMYGLYPGNLFTPHRNPGLHEACRKSMFRRHTHGAFQGGWPASWAVCLFARLKEAEVCGAIVKGMHEHRGASFMGAHFQIDCIYGLGAGIAEMLVQSHDGRIELLPALPLSWPEGHVSGLRTVGGFEVSIRWEAGRLTGGTVKSGHGGPCRVAGPGLRGALRDGKPIRVTSAADGTVEFVAESGKEYELKVE